MSSSVVLEDKIYAKMQSVYARAGIYFIAVGIQVFLCLYCLSIHLATPTKLRKGRTPYIFLLLFLGIMYIASQAGGFYPFYSMYLTSRPDSPRSKARTSLSGQFAWYEYITLVCVNSLTWVGDGLLIYRCFIVYREKPWVSLLPGVLYLAAVPLSLIGTIQPKSLKPQLAQIYSGWVLLTVLLNIIITLLISFRLIRLRNHLSKLFSQSQSQSAPRSQSWTESNRNNSNSGDPYLGVVALIVESAMPLSLIGIPLAALNFVNNPRANLASAILNRLFSAFMAFSPQMIIFRVTIGKSWVHRVEEKTANPGSVMSMPLAFGVKDDSESKGDMDLEYDLDTSKQTNSVS